MVAEAEEKEEEEKEEGEEETKGRRKRRRKNQDRMRLEGRRTHFVPIQSLQSIGNSVGRLVGLSLLFLTKRVSNYYFPCPTYATHAVVYTTLFSQGPA